MANGRRGGNKNPKKTTGFTVEGKSVEDLLKTGSAYLTRLTTPHLRQIVTRLSSAGNKRLRRAEKGGSADSPAIERVKQSGGKFTGKNKDRAGLEQEFLRLKQFFRDPTSTMEGWKRVQNEALRKAKRAGVIQEEPKKPPAWNYDQDTGTYSHPDYGEGFTLDEVSGFYVNMDTGESVENPRMYHDYDATADWRQTETGTETGDIWRAVDSLSKLDPRFGSYIGSYELRKDLFDAIDNAFVEHPGWSLDQARDYVSTRLDEIFNSQADHLGRAMDLGASTFFKDDGE